ncbi:alpha/beta hydrolase [Nocardia sp. NBC_00565]|uniref:alpha/beta hydrolase n=1 Tax=Nocardia sp. NBC_00565 TaxID=2975993 RepID=UPI002E812B47|nr:alpha/beta hydrolase [Nocardia sp. NBC_00565]WUC03023.1 alpha/beta hydrolase [Nocardia sp. NBC_00565]
MPAPTDRSVVELDRRVRALVTYEGIRHGSFLDGVECVDEPVLKYLIELSSPADGLRCAHAQ